jgi:hypothetical protein
MVDSMEKINKTDYFAQLTVENVQNIMKIEGKTRGAALKTDAEFILKEKGEEGVKKVEEKLFGLGCPIKYKEISSMEFYPIGLRIISLLAIRETFGFNEEKIKEIGLFASKTSLIMKFFMQYFLSLEKTLSLSSKIWEKYYSIGNLKSVESNEAEKFVRLRLENFNTHPVLCPYLGGFLSSLLKIIVKSSAISCEEVKCLSLGDECHEYLLKWK